MLHIRNIKDTKVLNGVEKKQWIREIFRKKYKQRLVIYRIGD